MRGAWVFGLLLASLAVSVVSEDVQIMPGWTVTRRQLDIFEGGLTKYIFDNYMYHWGQIMDGMRWDSQGFVDQEEMDFLVSHGDYNAAGGGFYVSEDKYDSKYFGPWPTVVVIPSGTLRYSNVWAGICFGLVPNKTMKAALGRIVPFIDEYWLFSKWRVVHSAKLTQQVLAGPRAPTKYQIPATDIGNATDYRSLYMVGAPPKFSESEDFKTLLKYWGLIDYLQPLGAKCALTLHPDDPFKAVDQNAFSTYLKIQKRASQNAPVYNQFSSSYSSAETYNKTRDFLNDITLTITGQSDDLMLYRTEELRAGNETNNYTIAVSNVQLKQLSRYGYLDINIVKQSDNNMTFVQIYYPHVLRYEEFAWSLSSSLKSEIRKYSKAQLKNDTTVRNDLNRKMLKELFFKSVQSMYSSSFPSANTIATAAAVSPFIYNDEILGAYFRSITGSISDYSHTGNYGMSFPASMYPFLIDPTSLGGNWNFPGLNVFNVRQFVHNPQWKAFLAKVFNGPKLDNLTARWMDLDLDLTWLYKDWKNRNYSQDECKLILKGDWTGVLDSRTSLWRNEQKLL